MTNADRRALTPRAPWISRDLYAETEITTSGHEVIRLEVRAFRLNPAVDAWLVFRAFRWEDGTWLELRGNDVPDDAAQEGSRLAALARGADLGSAEFGAGPSIDRTRDLSQEILDLSKTREAAALECDRCGHAVPEGKHHGHGFEILCEGCYGGRYDAHVAGVVAAMLEEAEEATASGECFVQQSSDDEEQSTRIWAPEELRDLAARFGEDYAHEVHRDAEGRVRLRLGGEGPAPSA